MEKNDKVASQLANLTYKLLTDCHQKEVILSKNFGLTQAEFRCITFFQTNEIINNKEIADRMDLSPSRLTRIIDGLVEKGYISREIEPNDRRNMRVCLSQGGINLIEKLNESYVNVHREVLKDINESEQKLVLSVMTKIFTAIDDWVQNTPN